MSSVSAERSRCASFTSEARTRKLTICSSLYHIRSCQSQNGPSLKRYDSTNGFAVTVQASNMSHRTPRTYPHSSTKSRPS